MSDEITRADVCAAAIADAFKDDGEIFGNRIVVPAEPLQPARRAA